MSKKKNNKDNLLVAKVVEDSADKFGSCVFCQRSVNDEVLFGKLYSIGDIYCHYFCVLLSCCLVQKGEDDQGLLGFMYSDILAEVERSKKHKCSYCGKGGATMGCSVSQCRKQFHIPCGRERKAVAMFFGNYKSFCEKHAPQQRVNPEIMEKAKPRLTLARKIARHGCQSVSTKDHSSDAECVCVICYEPVEGFPSTETFWPPCCARDEWFHRNCLQRMALSAGMHYIKCPLCNDKNTFYKAVVSQGYYLPDRDAAWELEQNAFAGMYERELLCEADSCLCDKGRYHDEENGAWDIRLCLVCGGSGMHRGCLNPDMKRFICKDCLCGLPRDGAELAGIVDALIAQEQLDMVRRPPPPPPRPRMTSRMSIRRTKPLGDSKPTRTERKETTTQATTNESKLSRQDLHLRSPKKMSLFNKELSKNNENLSPMKDFEREVQEKLSKIDSTVNHDRLIEQVKRDLKKPRPLSAKKKIVNGILQSVLDESSKNNTPIKESPLKKSVTPQKDVNVAINEIQSSNSPIILEPKTPEKLKNIRKSLESFIDQSCVCTTPKVPTTINTLKDSSMEISENNESVSINLIQIDSQNDNEEKNKSDKIKLKYYCFETQYLNELKGTNQHCDYNHKHIKREEIKKIKTPIDFAMEAVMKKTEKKEKSPKEKENLKRKLENSEQPVPKKKKKSKKNKHTSPKIKLAYFDEDMKKKNKKKRKKKSKSKMAETEMSIENKGIEVSIKWQEEQLKIKLKKLNKKKRRKEKREALKSKILTQTVLNFSPETGDSVIAKPEIGITPKKRKYNKHDKHNDQLKQTSLHSYFQMKSPEKLL